MAPLPVFRLVSAAWRRRRIPQLLEDLAAWEEEGRNILAKLEELTDEEDELHFIASRLLRALEE